MPAVYLILRCLILGQKKKKFFPENPNTFTTLEEHPFQRAGPFNRYVPQ